LRDFTNFSFVRLGGRSARHLERHVAVEWPLLKVQRTLATQDDECQVSAAAVIGLQNLTGCSQPASGIEPRGFTGALWPAV
jgi:hypothetical protein